MISILDRLFHGKLNCYIGQVIDNNYCITIIYVGSWIMQNLCTRFSSSNCLVVIQTVHYKFSIMRQKENFHWLKSVRFLIEKRKHKHSFLHQATWKRFFLRQWLPSSANKSSKSFICNTHNILQQYLSHNADNLIFTTSYHVY